MGSSKFDGFALCVNGFEENYLYEVGGEDRVVKGIGAFVREAGGRAVRSALPAAFEDEDATDVDDVGFYRSVRDEYRNETQRKHPPVMRVRVTVEVENLSDEEAGKVWLDHCAKMGERDEKP